MKSENITNCIDRILLVGESLLVGHTPRSMIGCWHHNVICLSVRPSV